MKSSDQQRVTAVSNKLATLIPKTSEARLIFAVVVQAITDLVAGRKEKPTKNELIDYDSAIKYLKGNMYHAELCGIDADYVRFVMRQNCIEI